MKRQPIRERRIITELKIKEKFDTIKKLSKEHEVTFSEAFGVIKLLEYQRRTDVMIDDFDCTDENIQGIYSGLISISDAINERNK